MRSPRSSRSAPWCCSWSWSSRAAGCSTSTGAPTCPSGCYRLVAYFTIQSNLLVAIAAAQLARDPARDGQGWRVLRLAGVAGIAITGLVHFVLLRPLLDLDGADYVADKLLHMAVPVLAVAGWAVVRAAPAGVTTRGSAWRSSGPSPGSPGRSSSAASATGTPTRSSTTARTAPGAVVVASLGITGAVPGGPRAHCLDRRSREARARARLEPMSRGHRPHRPSERHRLCRVRRARRLLVPPAPLRPVRPRRLLRHLARPARHRPLPGHRPPGDDQLRAG